jgi:hypothetical protein
VKSLLGDTKQQEHFNNPNPEDFAKYFSEKIEKIRSSTRTGEPPDFTSNTGGVLRKFRLTDVAEVTNIILSSPNKQCSLDPIPTWLVKKCINVLSAYLTNIFNISISTGQVPQQFKKAVVTPLLKKPQLDAENLSNFRPVSNLPFISKILEKIIVKQISTHIDSFNLLSNFQSAYRKFHSTETGLLRILSDITLANESGKISILALLDMSAAFDTIDHHFLIKRLEVTFGISELTKSWIQSYLSDRTQSILIAGKSSSFAPVKSGVPQGSVLGPMLFTLFINDVSKIIQSYELKSHCYADDQQIYFYSLPQDINNLKKRVSECIHTVTNWMTSNKLKLNPSKTEILMSATKKRQHLLDRSPISITGCDLTPEINVKLLGVNLDSDLSLQSQVNKTNKIHSQKYSTRRNKSACERICRFSS